MQFGIIRLMFLERALELGYPNMFSNLFYNLLIEPISLTKAMNTTQVFLLKTFTSVFNY